MIHNKLYRMFIISISIFIACGCCACTPSIDNDFLDAHSNTLHITVNTVQLPTEDTHTVTSEVTTDSKHEETRTESTKKPGGFILPDIPEDTTSLTTDITSDTPNTATPPETSREPDGPIVITSPGGTQIKVSSGLKAALQSIGRTSVTNEKIVALSTNKDNSGGLTILFIKNGPQEATRVTYIYYESNADYMTAKKSADASMCNDALRLITKDTTKIAPVSNPDTMSIVLFDGYAIWR